MTAGSGILHPNAIAEGNLVQRTDAVEADVPTFSATVQFVSGPEAAKMQFNLVFPRPRMHRVWVQFQRDGIVNTVHFDVPVTKGASSPVASN